MTTTNDPTIVLNLELGKVTNRRYVESDTEAITTDIDRKMLHVGVDLFDAKELRECHNFQVRLKRKLKRFMVPSFFRGGMYLVKVAAIERIDKIIEEAQVDFLPYVAAFADVVDQRRDEAQVRLAGAFDATAYPTREEVLEVYRIEHNWLVMSTPTSLKNVNAAIFKREREKAERQVQAAADSITKMLAAEAKGLGQHLINRLTTDLDGKKKQIRNSAVENVNEFLATFDLRNIGTSKELNEQVARMKEILKGVEASDLRDNDALRVNVRDSFTKVAATLDTLVVERPKRYMA